MTCNGFTPNGKMLYDFGERLVSLTDDGYMVSKIHIIDTRGSKAVFLVHANNGRRISLYCLLAENKIKQYSNGQLVFCKDY